MKRKGKGGKVDIVEVRCKNPDCKQPVKVMSWERSRSFTICKVCRFGPDEVDDA